MREVLLWTGAGQIGMAIARRVGYGKTVVVGDRSLEHAQAAAGVMNAAGFDVIPVEMDLSSRASIQALIREAQRHGEITMLVNAAGVSPSQAPYRDHSAGGSVRNRRPAGGGGTGHRPGGSGG